MVVKEQIEVLRQRKYKPVASMFLYYWSDACPIMGSGLLDYYREPYEVYESMKGVYTQVLISLEWNKDPYVIGREKKYDRTQIFGGKIWVNNDHFHEIKDAQIQWKIRRINSDEILADKSFVTTLAPDSAEVLDKISFIIPEDYIGEYIVEMSVKSHDNQVLSTNTMRFKACN